MLWTNLLGYAASASVLASFCMSSMVPLRAVAICSNVLFAAFGALAHTFIRCWSCMPFCYRSTSSDLCRIPPYTTCVEPRLQPENRPVARNVERSVATGDTGYEVRRGGFYHDDDLIQRQRGASMASNLETTEKAYELFRQGDIYFFSVFRSASTWPCAADDAQRIWRNK
jgi:hypothetical protein